MSSTPSFSPNASWFFLAFISRRSIATRSAHLLIIFFIPFDIGLTRYLPLAKWLLPANGIVCLLYTIVLIFFAFFRCCIFFTFEKFNRQRGKFSFLPLHGNDNP